MSNQDSFIAEVTEEVRKDRLYALYRKYGWAVLLGVLVLVGGAALNEWRKAAAQAEAGAAGDALLAALDNETAEGRAAALAAVELPEDAGRRAITLMMRAGALAEADDIPGAIDALAQVAEDAELPARVRDLAVLKGAILSAGVSDPVERMARLAAIANPGSPYRLLALEQIALTEIEIGEREKALTTLGRILEDADVTQDLRRRVSQLIVALGGELAAT